MGDLTHTKERECCGIKLPPPPLQTPATPILGWDWSERKTVTLTHQCLVCSFSKHLPPLFLVQYRTECDHNTSARAPKGVPKRHCSTIHIHFFCEEWIREDDYVTMDRKSRQLNHDRFCARRAVAETFKNWDAHPTPYIKSPPASFYGCIFFSFLPGSSWRSWTLATATTEKASLSSTKSTFNGTIILVIKTNRNAKRFFYSREGKARRKPCYSHQEARHGVGLWGWRGKEL